MYFYVVDSQQARRRKKLFEEINDKISLFGITGETSSPSPARTIEEIISSVIQKQNPTIIAIGTDLFINKVYSVYCRSKVISADEKKVFGFIPTQPESELANIFRLETLNHAIETIRNRKLARLSVAYLQPNKYFLSPLLINPKEPFAFGIETANWQAVGQATRLLVNYRLQVSIVGAPPSRNFLIKALNWLTSTKKDDLPHSLFHAESLKIFTAKPALVKVCQAVWAKTPLHISKVICPLHIIIPRARILSRDISKKNKEEKFQVLNG